MVVRCSGCFVVQVSYRMCGVCQVFSTDLTDFWGVVRCSGCFVVQVSYSLCVVCVRLSGMYNWFLCLFCTGGQLGCPWCCFVQVSHKPRSVSTWVVLVMQRSLTCRCDWVVSVSALPKCRTTSWWTGWMPLVSSSLRCLWVVLPGDGDDGRDDHDPHSLVWMDVEPVARFGHCCLLQFRSDFEQEAWCCWR